jgi:hypothetical protein
MESRKLEAGMPIYEDTGRVVMPHGGESVLLMGEPFCFLFFRDWIKDFTTCFWRIRPPASCFWGTYSQIFISFPIKRPKRSGFLARITSSVEI